MSNSDLSPTAFSATSDSQGPTTVTASTTTTIATTTSPVDAVFGTYELLESMLMNLNVRELSKVQRVSPEWKDIILRSKRPKTRMWFISPHEPIKPVFNEARAFPPEYQTHLKFHPAFYVGYRKHRRRCKHGHRGTLKDYGMGKCGVADEGDPKAQQRAANRKYPPKNYSYGNMLATEPPVTVVIVFEEWTTRLTMREERWAGNLCSVQNPDGVTLGDICRAAGSMKSGHESVTGQKLPLGKFGFEVVDPRVPEASRARLKAGCRFGGCEVCERLETEKETKDVAD